MHTTITVVHYAPCNNPAGIYAIRSFEKKSDLVKYWWYIEENIVKKKKRRYLPLSSVYIWMKEKGLYYILIYSDNCCHLGYFNETNDR